ncbi:MAG: hypothetical protein NT069_01705 [Planctomycetota bacterium]|nr:hypothetical protein [Planctomycetota bacterium]
MDEEQDDFAEARQTRRPRKATGSKTLPVFVLVMMILDILFSLGRVLTAFANFSLVFVAQQRPQFQSLVGISVACGILDVLLFLLGLPAAIGILMKAPWGRALGWVAMAVTALSIPITAYSGFLAIPINMQGAIAAGADRGAIQGAAVVGVMIGAAIRVVILVLYIIALVEFGKWLAARPAENDD